MKKPKTLKAKLTLAYAAGFFISLAGCFAAIYLVQRHILLRAVNNRLDYFAREFKYEFLTATEFTPQHTLLDISALPEPCPAVVRRGFPGFKILSAVTNPGRRVEVIGEHGGGILRLTFSSDNTAVEAADVVGDVDRATHMDFEFNEESYGEGKNRFFFLLFAPDGALLARAPFDDAFVPRFAEHNLRQLQLARPEPRPGRHRSLGAPDYLRNNGVRMRTLRHTLHDGSVLLLAANLSDLDRNLNRLIGIFAVSLVVMLTASLGIGWLIAGQVSRALNRVTAAAREIESGDYSKRVGRGAGGREIDSLVDAFNDMTGKTERLLAELKTISENIAHDLRTPLTRMRGKAELTLYTGADSELAGVVAEECADMLELINTTLEITQAECRFDFAPMAPVDLRDLAARSLELFSTLAEDKQITLSSGLPGGPVPFNGHASKLQRMIANLLDNAFKFTPRGGGVTLSLAQAKTAVTLSVSDTGVGIPLADQPHVFERFYRSSASRSLPGNGLGLCLVRAIVLAHNGDIRLESVPGKGSAFIITLPAQGGADFQSAPHACHRAD